MRKASDDLGFLDPENRRVLEAASKAAGGAVSPVGVLNRILAVWRARLDAAATVFQDGRRAAVIETALVDGRPLTVRQAYDLAFRVEAQEIVRVRTAEILAQRARGEALSAEDRDFMARAEAAALQGVQTGQALEGLRVLKGG